MVAEITCVVEHLMQYANEIKASLSSCFVKFKNALIVCLEG